MHGPRPGKERVRRGQAGTRPVVTTVIVLAAAVLAAGGVLAGCGQAGGGSGQTSPSTAATAAPAPGGCPLAGTAEQAAATYWALVDADDYERVAAACVPGSAAAVTRENDDIARVRLVRAARVAREAGAAQVQVDVQVTPDGEATPWGGRGRHTLFMELQRAGSGWLVAGWGTSP